MDEQSAALPKVLVGPQRSGGAEGGTTVPRQRTLLDIFNATALRCPDNVAIEAPDGRLTYRELAEAAERLARQLVAVGAGPGERVGVRVASGPAALYTAILGVLFSGAAYVPVEADEPRERAF